MGLRQQEQIFDVARTEEEGKERQRLGWSEVWRSSGDDRLARSGEVPRFVG